MVWLMAEQLCSDGRVASGPWGQGWEQGDQLGAAVITLILCRVALGKYATTLSSVFPAVKWRYCLPQGGKVKVRVKGGQGC